MVGQTGRAIFADAIRAAVAAGCADWGYARVGDEWFATFDSRVPADIAERVGAGMRDGLITTEGYYFRAAGLPANKGPYKLVGRGGSGGTPQAHWEYYVQLDEYVRLVRRFADTGLTIGLEDGLMDVSVRRGEDLLWCVEVKEKPGSLRQLIAAFQRYGPAVPMDEPDRHNDGLRKSKYLVRHRPPFLSLLALGDRHDFVVTYPGPSSFLMDDLPDETGIEQTLIHDS